MQCYTRTDDYFGEIERFIRVQRVADNIDHALSKQATAQLDTISGENDTWWENDFNFVRTAAVVLRMLMLQATKIHPKHDSGWMKNLVSRDCKALKYNKDSIHTNGIGQMPCPADSIDEARCIAACYDTQFNATKMKLQLREMPRNAGWFTETMAVVKRGDNNIKFWFIITTWCIRKYPQERCGGFLYEAVPIVVVIYMKGNRQARDDWRQEERQDILQLEQLMENLNIDGNLRQAIRDNRAEAARDQDAA